MKKGWLLLLLLVMQVDLMAQRSSVLPADKWVDSVFSTLSDNEKIAQLMVIRSSGLKDGTPVFFDEQVMAAVRKYNIGGICLFQGGPVQHAQRINSIQSAAKTPVLVTVDGEWGLGMRFDSVLSLPRQMMMAAVPDATIMYDYGKIVAAQCTRMGIQVNYAPVVDINNNPDNPVINDRSFGENKYRVAELGLQYMKGLQDHGVMACAKHFPGHGDVAVDSHKDLPIILKTRAELDSMELYPFNVLFKAGVGSVMIAHLSVPAIDNTANLPTSLSKKNIDGLLRNELGFQGLSFTDALEMQGVAKYFPDGEGSARSLIAGNDMLCLPGDIPGSIKRIRKAIKKKNLSWNDLNSRVRKVLYAKYQYGLANWMPIDLHHLADDLNKDVPRMRRRAAEQGLTLLRNDNSTIPFPSGTTRRVAYIGIGLTQDNRFAERIRTDYNAHTYYFDYDMDSVKANALLALIQNRYDVVIMAFHNYNRRPANNFGISNAAVYLANKVSQQQKTITVFFGNPYAIKNACNNSTLIAAYEDDAIVHETTADLLNGKFQSKGKLPVNVCNDYPYGSGIVHQRALPDAWAGSLGFNYKKLQAIDSICENAIAQKAIPGCVVLVAKDGKIAYERSFGRYAYTDSTPVYCETLYDLASVTKVMAATLAVMKLYDEGRLDLAKTLGDYLPWTKSSNKAGLVIKDVLLHEAGLKDFIPFYKETIDPADGVPSGAVYGYKPDSLHTVRVADNLYMRTDFTDTLYQRILQSKLTERGKYIYSDNDFIFLGKVVEAITGKPLDQYVQETFYAPLSLTFTGFRPRLRYPKNYIAPTEMEPLFRRQLIQGDVHDPGAAMFGGVAGHAGLFSNAYELAVLSQLLLNKGTINGVFFFKPATIELFTAYNSGISRRGLGFDKPEKDNASRSEPYPSRSVSAATFGHTGFTGTCIWIDPQFNLTYIFLSNRVNNNGDPGRFSKMNVRPNIQEVIYGALEGK
ncbi:glycoside hydrolase family 3 N-terminal domain-containing protein [Flavihumibacter fluvii]|uniref:glycoside hydrolase family 3 N-terminal domain-containing protein n=1 Tax=Flavihumibacter fluvii TaxID=2838157 RepID=UPI001BDF147E|nr:glycoside hydrolase family 3 N-terminal domain-containing protein [Flavihumibacter fluvii]ULQ52302.1 serine hydrolase [Flavihumibacter fluvii]